MFIVFHKEKLQNTRQNVKNVPKGSSRSVQSKKGVCICAPFQCPYVTRIVIFAQQIVIIFFFSFSPYGSNNRKRIKT